MSKDESSEGKRESREPEAPAIRKVTGRLEPLPGYEGGDEEWLADVEEES